MMSVDFVICNPRPMHSWSPVHERCLLLGTVGQDGDDDDDPRAVSVGRGSRLG